MLKRIIGENISVTLQLDGKLPPVELDRGQIEQVVVNLAVNARDAMEAGGVLTVKTTVVDINGEYCASYRYAQPGKYVCMIFEDTGTGMDQETITKVFKPFFTTKKGGKGTGLGLSLVYSIVKDHGGWIHVYSEPAKGSNFKIYLPVTTLEEEPEDEPIETPAAVQGRGERILFVEDDRDIYRFVKEHLSQSGYTVFVAQTVQEAVELFKKRNNNIDILITDVVLPDKSGIELARLLLAEKPELKVLLTSGYLDREEDWGLIDDKTYRFIQKPYSLTDLLRNVGETADTKG
jgi:two-component system cell cycle sensor histidine kinase/response regulator CckA